jgi:hypothetical protein
MSSDSEAQSWRSAVEGDVEEQRKEARFRTRPVSIYMYIYIESFHISSQLAWTVRL